MYYTNSMKLTMKNAEATATAMNILRTRLAAGFCYDKDYKRVPSMLMLDNLEIEENIIFLPEDFGCYLPDHAGNVISELMQNLATQLSTENFSFNVCNNSDYDEGWVMGNYADGELKIKTTYFPSGFCDYYCPECDEVVATMKDDAEGNLFIECKKDTCPECGEEIDLSCWRPVIVENTIKII